GGDLPVDGFDGCGGADGGDGGLRSGACGTDEGGPDGGGTAHGVSCRSVAHSSGPWANARWRVRDRAVWRCVRAWAAARCPSVSGHVVSTEATTAHAVAEVSTASASADRSRVTS